MLIFFKRNQTSPETMFLLCKKQEEVENWHSGFTNEMIMSLFVGLGVGP